MIKKNPLKCIFLVCYADITSYDGLETLKERRDSVKSILT